MIIYNKNSLNFSIDSFGKPYTISMDPKVMRKDKINITTHGHTDHTPRKVTCTMMISSDITRKLVEHRLQKSLLSKEKFANDYIKISLKDAGHCLGSKTVLVENKESGLKTLYTGDYNTNTKKYCGTAKPIKCHNLIVDSTYGSPKYSFPDYSKTVKEFVDYLKDNQDKKIAIVTYSFGKPQEISHILNSRKIPFSVDENISSINKKINLKYQYNKPDSNIILTRKKIPGYKNISLSGHAVNRSFSYTNKFDKAFAISDHTDFQTGIDFVKNCEPENVYTLFRYKQTFAAELRRILGINAVPLESGQHIIQNYFINKESRKNKKIKKS